MVSNKNRWALIAHAARRVKGGSVISSKFSVHVCVRGLQYSTNPEGVGIRLALLVARRKKAVSDSAKKL